MNANRPPSSNLDMLGALVAIALLSEPAVSADERHDGHFVPIEADLAGGVATFDFDHAGGRFSAFIGPRFGRSSPHGSELDFGTWTFSLGPTFTGGRTATGTCSFSCATFVTVGLGLRFGHGWVRGSDGALNEAWPSARAYVQLTPFIGYAWNDSAPLAPATSASVFGLRLGFGGTLQMWTRWAFDTMHDKAWYHHNAYAWLLAPLALINHGEMAIDLAAQRDGSVRVGLVFLLGTGL